MKIGRTATGRGELISVEAYVDHCSTCHMPIVLGAGEQPEGKLQFIQDDHGNRWVIPHAVDCPRLFYRL